MNNQSSTWDEIQRIADQLELEIHLASMDARDRWQALQPRIAEIKKSIASAGKRASDVVEHELSSIGDAVRRLRDDIAKPAKS